MKTSSERLASGAWLVRVEGEADFGTSPEMEDALRVPLAEPRPRLLLDLSALTYISSAGLRVLLRAHQRASRAGGWLRLFGAQRGVTKVLDETGLAGTLRMYASQGDAESAPEERE